MPRIFISYRRDDAPDTTRLIYDRLVRVYGRRSVFVDVANIRPSRDFRAEIERWLFNASAVLVVIGPDWLTITDEKGQPRISLHDDPVRHEIEFALVHRKRIIPLYVDDARPPRPEHLPPSIQSLAYTNGLTIRQGEDFSRDVSRLIQLIGLPWARVALALLLIVTVFSLGLFWLNDRTPPSGSSPATTAWSSPDSPTAPVTATSQSPIQTSVTATNISPTPNITEVAAELYAAQTAFYGTQTGVADAAATAYQVQTLIAQTEIAAVEQTQLAAARATQTENVRSTVNAQNTQMSAAQQTQSARSTATVQTGQTAVVQQTESARSTNHAQATQTTAVRETQLARSTATVQTGQTAVAQQTESARSTNYARATQTEAAQQTQSARSTANVQTSQTAVARQTESARSTNYARATQTGAAQDARSTSGARQTRTAAALTTQVAHSEQTRTGVVSDITATYNRQVRATQTARALVTPTRTPRPSTSVPMTAFHVTVSVSSANLRSGPDTAYPTVDTASYGDRFAVIARTNDGAWYLIDRAGGDAWISATVVSLDGSGLISTPATIPAPPIVQATSSGGSGGGTSLGTPANGTVRYPSTYSCGAPGTSLRLNGIRTDLGQNLTVMEQPGSGNVLAWFSQNGRVFTLAEESAAVYDSGWNSWIDWCQVRLDDGRLGWALRQYIWGCDVLC